MLNLNKDNNSECQINKDIKLSSSCASLATSLHNVQSDNEIQTNKSYVKHGNSSNNDYSLKITNEQQSSDGVTRISSTTDTAVTKVIRAKNDTLRRFEKNEIRRERDIEALKQSVQDHNTTDGINNNATFQFVEGHIEQKFDKTNILPDIINVQITKDFDETDDSLISSLTNNLNSLDLNFSKDKNHSNVPQISLDNDSIQSDGKLFVECQTFTELTQHFENNDFNNSQKNCIGIKKSHNKNWDNILSNVVVFSNKESLQEHNLNLRNNSTIQGNEILSRSEPTLPKIESTEILTKENVNKILFENFTEKYDDVYLNSRSSELELPNSVSNQKVEKSELDMDKAINASEYMFKEKNDSNKNSEKVKLELLDTSGNLDVYVPQVLLRQKKMQTDFSDRDNSTEFQKTTNISENVNQTISMNHSRSSKDSDLISKTLKFDNCNSDNFLMKSNKSTDVCQEIPIDEMKIYTDSLEDSNMNSLWKTEIESNSSFDQEHIFENIDTKNLQSEHNKTVNNFYNFETHFEGFSKEINLNNSKILNHTFDNNLESNLINSNSCKKTVESPNNIIFTASSKGINSTMKSTLNCEYNVSTNNSPTNDDTSFNQNKTVHIDEMTNEISNVKPSKIELHQENYINLNDSSTGLERDESIELNASNEQFSFKIINTSMEIEKSKDEQQEIEIEFSEINIDLSTANVNDAETDFAFKLRTIPPPTLKNNRSKKSLGVIDEDFHNQTGLTLSEADFDFLLSKKNDCEPTSRDSLLLRFDPLLGHASLVTQQDKTILQKIPEQIYGVSSNFINNQHSNNRRNNDNSVDLPSLGNLLDKFESSKEQTRPVKIKNNQIKNLPHDIKSDVKMSVDVIHDIKIENNEVLNTQSEEKQDYKMEDLEKKIKNEVLKTEDIEKKLKEAEQREEALIKRITEKDKAIAKMSGVIEAYEKALAELIAEKEQIKQNYERQITELKADRDSNYQHLLSLESTFSDLHVKYERSKQTTEKLRRSEEDLLAEKKKTAENLRLQEERYEKMKSHALQQLEIANNKLDVLSKSHTAEVTKLKALLKKEEISRLSIAEQLQQKARENEELMKICDELINGQGS